MNETLFVNCFGSILKGPTRVRTLPYRQSPFFSVTHIGATSYQKH
jgi:hypothetical protein